jgi:vanillate O-demethylase monooxygenase subunit
MRNVASTRKKLQAMSEFTNDHPALRRCWHGVARSNEVGSAPHRALLLGEPWVLWRDEAGQIVAFADQCAHRRAPLSFGSCEGGSLRCGYHGWRFDGTGRCVEIPALGSDAAIPPQAQLRPPAGLAESHGVIYLAPEDPISPLPRIPEAEDPNFMLGELPVIRTRGSAALLADNFLDMAHFPFVHAGTFGADEARQVEPYELTRTELGHEVVLTHAFANREDPGVAAGLRPLIQQRKLTYSFTAPFHVTVRIDFLDAGGSNQIGFVFCPESPETTRVYAALWRNDLGGDEQRMKEAVDFEAAVVDEDLRIQAHYDLLSVSLDPSAELHIRPDRTTLEMRRVLAELVERAGS